MEQKRLGYGWMRLPLTNPDDRSTVDIERARGLADEFLAHGFSYFDTAYIYHNGQSERILRECVVERYPRDQFTVATKMPMLNLKTPEDQVRIYEDQKKQLGVDFFDYYLLHNLNSSCYDRALEFGTIDYLREKKKKGEICHLGFSFHDTAEYLDKILTENPDFEFVQLQINYLDWDSTGVQSRLCCETARRHGKWIIIMEPCKGGTLAQVPPAAEQLLREAHPDWSPASWAIRFAAGLPDVRMVLSGMSDEEQLADNMSFMEDFVPLSEEDVKLLFRVRDILEGSIAIPCTGCRYCVEEDRCPQNIAIPNYFSLYNTEQMDTNPSWSSQAEYYKNLTKQGYGRAGDCIECHQCEEICPQHIKVTDWLKKVSERFDEGIGDWRPWR